MPPSRESSSSPDSLLSDDSYLYTPQEQHNHLMSSSNPQPPTRSSTSTRSNTPPDANRTPTPHLLDLSEFAIKPPPILDELDKMAESMEPVEKLVSGAERAVVVAEMVNLLIEVEKALGEGDSDRAGEIATRGLEVAVELDDLENIERAKRLLDLVGGAAEKRKDMRGMEDDEDEYKDGQTERGGREEDMSFDDDKIRGASPNAGAEVLGDFLADEFEEEGDWGYEYGNENNVVEAGSDYGSQAQDEANNENDGDDTDDIHSNADNQDDQDDQDDEDHYNGFDPRNRPQTPVPPRSYDDDMEIPRPITATKDLIQRYDPWQAYADFKQKELFSSSEVNSSEDNLDEIYCDCDCRNCRKCHYNQESYFSSESEAEDEDEDEDENAITATIIRKRRRRDPIVSTNLNYTYTRKLIPKRSVISSKFSWKGAIPQYPKPWYRTDENTDLDNDFNALFWHPHTKTLLLQEDNPDWDMSWLPVEEPVSQDNNGKPKSSPLEAGTKYDDEGKNYIPWRTDFWFHFAMPMRDMASRVRKTDIFPEQAWEFIPKKEDWDMFEEAVPEGERFSMQFLEWERERIQGLVREKGEFQKGQFKQRQNQEQSWVFVQVDDSAMDWAMWVFVVVVALILLVFCLVL
ncbi:hypothetical protein ASPVEDRAFT_891768 [Aspergillus versicolor CBS 583.65]|uniref:Uncharacterized protein n=1 Tax=Aspergillus versicolor CBS 583.65 TaxID=1036611 RepID=A0A1L9PRZ8_ASPVE|nr:uncharacterized protein ASPVEDRAFT_891768 [Aspergillus versicolor CBS 583.65]OJJ04307.1 hypothetical protein ASPVEDRAFT_891768 [Aspergillus versicolor CBS 583.65]